MKARGRWLIVIVLGFFVGIVLSSQAVEAGQMTNRRLHISDNLAGATNVTYDLSFNGQSTGTVGSIRLQFCANDPFPGYPCTPPIGMDASQAELVSQSGMTGFSVHSSTTWNEVVLTRSPASSATGTVRYQIDKITNSTTAGTTYVRLETFASGDASGPSLDAGGMAIATTPSDVSIRTYVPPYMLMCIGNTIQPYDCATASGNYIDFGEFSPTRTASAHTRILIATNAEFGYTIRASGPTLASGTNTIPGMATADVSRPGTSQFGLNLRLNNAPPSGSNPSGPGIGSPSNGYNTPNTYKFVPGEVIASNPRPEDYRMYTVNYIVNISRDQSPGVYVTTLNYIATATF